jgi:hypothetical protein
METLHSRKIEDHPRLSQASAIHIDTREITERMLALDQVLRDPWSSLAILDFDNLLKVERKTKQRLRDLGPFLGPFWDLGICNGYGNVGPWVYSCLGLFCNL